jgi:transposase
MRGEPKEQPEFCTLINPETRIPQDHPLRVIKQRVEEVLRRLSPQFDQLYAANGRPSIPPEQLLKARLLMALYSVRSERLFCEQLAYNLLWLWFLDRELDEGSWDHSSFSQNQERVLSTEGAQLFFYEVFQLSREQGWAGDQHFSADGTLIESWASLKSFARKDGPDPLPRHPTDDDPGNPTIDFKGQRRTNDTHQSTTDPDAVLYRKGRGKEAKLYFGGQVLMDNRHGLCAQIAIHNPIAASEDRVALQQTDQHREVFGVCPVTVGADKLYHQRAFVQGCRERGPACRYQGQRRRARLGRTHHPGFGLSDQPADSQTHRGNLRVDEDRGRIATQSLSGDRPHPSVGLLRGQCLQPVADGQTGTGHQQRLSSTGSGRCPHTLEHSRSTRRRIPPPQPQPSSAPQYRKPPDGMPSPQNTPIVQQPARRYIA